MRLVFDPNISVDGVTLDAPAYNGPFAGRGNSFEKDVADLLWSLSMFRVGRAVINAINRRNQRKLFIIPFIPQAADPFNAYADPVQWQASVAPGQIGYERDLQDSQHRSHPHPEWGLGTGQGTDVQIRYTPWITSYDRRLYFVEHRERVPWLQIRGTNPLAPGKRSGRDPAPRNGSRRLGHGGPFHGEQSYAGWVG